MSSVGGGGGRGRGEVSRQVGRGGGVCEGLVGAGRGGGGGLWATQEHKSISEKTWARPLTDNDSVEYIICTCPKHGDYLAYNN